MRILALETATREGSVALLDGDRVVDREFEARGESAVAACGHLLAEEGVVAASLDGVAVSVGPGSFTGVRIGVSAAQGIALGAGIPAIPVGTLEGLAWTARESDWGMQGALLLPSVDARRAEVYAALYRVVAEMDPELLWGPEAVSCVALVEKFAKAPPRGGKVAAGVLSGDGAALLAPLFPEGAGWARPSVLARPSARGVARAAARRLAEGGGVAPEELQPIYLRKSDAEIQRESRLSPDG